ncbi:MAG: DEAD/DEAH box helicase family protein, partial [Candidatus Azambacteria bacterium]|nr:DEAD/DEAH box helicase family protein [Candidatus Azambacteria bacterium]
LFGYQRKAFDLIVDAFKEKTIALVVMATGLGKTIVSAFWAQKEIMKGHKGLFLCHNNGILDQAMVEFRKVLGEQAILKPFYGLNKDFDADKANIVFASFQTCANWKDVFFENEFDFIIVDESHHGQAPTFKKVILYFKPKKLLGITATPDRMDLKDIREIFGQEVINFTLEEAITKGWLTQVEYHILNDHLSHWKLKRIMREARKNRRVSVKQINETIFIQKRDEEIARIIQEYAGKDKKTIIFCEKIEHADNFQSFLLNSLTYHSKVPGGEKENRIRLNAFREGSLQYILTVNKFNEGIDVPDAEVIVFSRCTDSKTIFYQQLGRGLRKILGKSKVIVLDFVANCERLAMVKELVDRINELAGKRFIFDKRILRLSGAGFDFAFSDDQIDILNLVKRINEPFYETWQKASKAAVNLKIRSIVDYHQKYRVDPKLTSHPQKYYHNFPGWYVFLGKPKVEFHSTWQEANRIVRRFNIPGSAEYRLECKNLDLRLPSRPEKVYRDFPGWDTFLGIERHYPNWLEASRVAQAAGIRTKKEYTDLKKSDPKLPVFPEQFYNDFPGWDIFLGGYRFYPTWQEASAAVIKLGLKSMKEYQKGYKQDKRLPSYPAGTYKDFPGWVKFFGKTRKKEFGYYSVWSEASKASIVLGIIDRRDYQKKYRTDSKLPGSPSTYYKDFPSWKKFLGKEK